MDDGKPIYMSAEGHEKLQKELHKLKYTDRPEIVAEIKRAREMGDLSENAEYHAAKEAQVHLERQISDLEFKLSRAKVIKKDEIVQGKAYLLSKVTLKDLNDGEEIVYTLVSAEESDPDEDLLSVKSPIGQGLLGKSIGDEISIKIPAGELRYKIVNIE
jgi:transcription elongation factor GreA